MSQFISSVIRTASFIFSSLHSVISSVQRLCIPIDLRGTKQRKVP